MMRSLYSGVAGLRAHQTRMDVIGNNIANVNTVGFKGSRVTFRDVLYQSYGNPSAPSVDAPARGGTNPSQIGLGVMVSSIDTLNTRSGPQTTDRPLDCYIDGEGYFKVQGPDGSEYYTRVGDFHIDSLGQLVDGNGNYVIGINGDDVNDRLGAGGFASLEDIGDDEERIYFYGDDDDYVQNKFSQLAIGMDGVITAYNNETDSIQTLGRVLLYKFPNNDGLTQVGNTYLQVSANSGEPTVCESGMGGTGKLASSRLEMSNVELAKEFTDMIITQRGFQANSRIITVSDEMLQELVNLKR